MPFFALACRRGWTRPNGLPPSHVLMNGGCLYVPDVEHRDFLSAYSAAIDDHGESLYVVERPSQQIRFYADFDLKVAADEDVESFVTRLASEFAKIAARRLPTDSPTVVLRAEAKHLDESTQKIGVHLVLPRTRMSVDEAEAARARVLEELCQDDVLREPVNGWDDAFDASVYRNGGLRLVGSRKMAPCDCTGPCLHPQRKVDAGRPYLFSEVRDSSGEIDATWTRTLRQNGAMRAMMACIRIPCDDVVPHDTKKRKRVTNGRTRTSSLRWADLVDGPVASPHANLSVIAQGVFLRLEGQGCRYCPNVQREHSTSTVYAVQVSAGVSLRCRCRKGTCPMYRGPTLPLTRRGAELLGVHTSASGLPPGFV